MRETSAFAGGYPRFADYRVNPAPVPDRIGIEVTEMKFDSTTILFTMLLIVTGTTLLLGSQVGAVSLDRMEPFWPVTIVATGMARLLNWRDKRQS